eukprot:61438_1
MSSVPSVTPDTIKKIYESITPSPTKQYANEMDKIDPLKRFRYEFNIPTASNNCNRKEAIYFCGFGLGLQPKSTLTNLQEACLEWGKLGALSYTDGKRPLRYCEVRSEELLIPLIGAKNIKEIAVMNACSINANLLMTSFYRPTSERYKILIEGGAFCSDYHIIKGQMNLHNIISKDALIEIYPNSYGNDENEYIINNQQFIDTIHKHNTSIAMIWLGCTQHLSGQLFDIKNICNIAHKYGIYIGLDLAHGIGNIPLYLHDWNVDFAAFCGYKYLNGGGGAIGGIFVHEKHHNNISLKKQIGWWGQDLKQRYKFLSHFKTAIGAKSWAISQTPLFQCVALETSLEIFHKAGILNLRQKSIKLTGYLQLLIEYFLKYNIKIITPCNVEERGCQLALAVLGTGNEKVIMSELNEWLLDNGVICSIRKPNIIRIAPTPLFNTFNECWDFVQIIKQYFNQSINSKL